MVAEMGVEMVDAMEEGGTMAETDVEMVYAVEEAEDVVAEDATADTVAAAEMLSAAPTVGRRPSAAPAVGTEGVGHQKRSNPLRVLPVFLVPLKRRRSPLPAPSAGQKQPQRREADDHLTRNP